MRVRASTLAYLRVYSSVRRFRVVIGVPTHTHQFSYHYVYHIDEQVQREPGIQSGKLFHGKG